MKNTVDLMRRTMEGMNPAIIFDIKRYHPRAWAIYENHKKDFMMKNVTIDLNRGIKEGMFRDDINVEFMAKYRMEQVELGFNTDVFSTINFNIVEIQTTLLEHFIRGILTEKGLKQYNTFQQTV